MKFTNSVDGIERVSVRVEYRLTRTDLIDALCSYTVVFDDPDDLPEEMGEAKALGRIRHALQDEDHNALDGWANGVDDATEYIVRTWATRQVDRLWP